MEERQLVVPALVLLDNAPSGALPTGELSRGLRALLKPSGDDVLILDNRTDDRFSQKVRNLKSHNTLLDRGFAEHIDGGFRITDKGRAEARRQADSINALAAFPLDTTGDRLADIEAGAELLVIDESIVTEGQLSTRTVRYRKRSAELRRAAVEHYTVSGKILCASCSFDFSRAYADIGTGYIQIHHLEPIAFGGERELSLNEAIDKVRPLCANCHVMVHRRDPWLTMERLADSLSVTFDYREIDYAGLGKTVP